MAYCVYFIRVPRYKGVSLEQIRLIDSFLRSYESKNFNVFEKWGAVNSMKDLPAIEVIKYYKTYFDRQHTEDKEDTGGYRCYGIFERIWRSPKSSQFLEWAIRNGIKEENDLNFGSYEITREQLENLLDACNQTRRYGITYHNNPDNFEVHYYEVNKSIAKAFLPIMELKGYEGHLMFPYEYGNQYAKQVIKAIRVINDILVTTDFEKQSIYIEYK